MTSLVLALLQADLSAAIAKTRAESSYEVKYAGEGTFGGVAFKRWGVGSWRSPGVLVLQGEADGNRKEYIVRAGVLYGCGKHTPSYDQEPCSLCNGARRPTELPRVWVHMGELNGWMTADDAADGWAAQGAQNPHELLGLLAPFSDQAKAVPGGFRIGLQGNAAVRLAAAFKAPACKPAGTTVTVELSLDPQGRIGSIQAVANLVTPEGVVPATADFTLERFGEARVPARLGPGKAGEKEARIRAAIDAELQR